MTFFIQKKFPIYVIFKHGQRLQFSSGIDITKIEQLISPTTIHNTYCLYSCGENFSNLNNQHKHTISQQKYTHLPKFGMVINIQYRLDTPLPGID